MKRTFLTILCAFPVAACSAQTLDGGSVQNGSRSQEGSSPQGGAEIADTPLAGSIAGRTFEAKSIDIHYSSADGQWLFSIDNYESDCGSLKTRPDPASSMTVTVGAIEPIAGTFSIRYADAHAATFQVGLYDTSQEPETYLVRNGTIRFDTWDETPGAQIGGALELSGDEAALEGTFMAKMCPPR